jgi:hypothetical protein
VYDSNIAGIWFNDSRHYAYAGIGLQSEPTPLLHVVVLDTENGVTVDLGEALWDPDAAPRYYDYEVIDRWVLWRTEAPTPEAVREREPDFTSWDTVKAYNVDTRVTLTLLEPDPETLTITRQPSGRYSCFDYNVMMIPGANVPAALKTASLYKRCSGRYAGVSEAYQS